MGLTVDALCRTVTSGGTPSRKRLEYFQPATIPWVKTMDLRDGPISTYDEYISEKGLRNSAAKVLPPGAVLIAMYGATVGRLGWLTESASCNQAACAMVADPDSCDSRWLYYAIMWARPTLIGLASGAAQQNLNTSLIRSLELPALSLWDQQSIGQVLGALDDKIAANEEVSRVIDQLSATEVDLSRGVEKRPLGELLRLHYGKALAASSRVSGRIPVYGSSGVTGAHDEALVEASGVVVGRKGNVGSVYWSDGPHYPIDTTYYVEEISSIPSAILYYLLRGMRLSALNNDSAVPGLNRENAYAQMVAPPPSSHVPELLRRIGQRFREAAAIKRESQQLVTTRDELLPLLMSGKLRVRDAEKVVEGVL